MISSRHVTGMVLAVFLVFTGACGFDLVLSPTSPSLRPSEFRATGFVEDDGCLPGPFTVACRRLSGVRVEALGYGRSATTDADGRFDLGLLPSRGVGNVLQLSGSLPGWTTGIGYIGLESAGGVSMRMGQEPHTLHGWVYLDSGFPRPPVSNAGVEILDGPNAGKRRLTDSEGLFVFDDLITSSEFRIEASKIGHKSVTVVQRVGLIRNGDVVGLYLK